MWAEEFQEEEARKCAQKAHQARLESGMSHCAATPDGQYLLCWLVNQRGVFDAPYPQGHAEAAFLAGKRQIGLCLAELLARIGAQGILFSTEVKHG